MSTNYRALCAERMDALNAAKLVYATCHSGRNAYWEVHRVGPK